MLLRIGVDWMLALSRRDPTHPFSWTFQANIHGRPKFPAELVVLGRDANADRQFRLFADKLDFSPTVPVFETCPHGNWWFLPWHRAYLFYFERILRWAAKKGVEERKSTGAFPRQRANDLLNRVDELVLPYWNYVKSDRRILPDAFRKKGGEDFNPLFLPDKVEYADAAGVSRSHPVRSRAINEAESELSGRITVLSALRKIPFTTTSLVAGDSFGGAKSDTLSGSAGDRAFGTLEQIPHNKVHTALGGDASGVGSRAITGLMGDVPTAARDPIFWLHHCEIDRLGVVWLKMGGGRAFPTEVAWLDKEFTFYDVDDHGQPKVVTTKVNDLLKTEDLGYEYDDLTPPDLSAEPQLFAAATFAAPAFAGQTMQRPIASSKSTALVRAGSGFVAGEMVAVNLDNKTDPLVPLEAASGLPQGFVNSPDRRYILSVEEIGFEATPGINYEVYLLPKNLKELPENDDARSSLRAGAVTFFGLKHHGGGHDGQPSLRLDVTGTVRYLLDRGARISEQGLNVVLLRETGLVARNARAGEGPRERDDVLRPLAAVKRFQLLGAE
jgi:tyrosinase